ncbi:hypothetical protein C4K19_1100 [Pseudomonas chlororaphis subsp. aurantiaca]|nr:hypothetical protein C4K19_1100 [Pseudomonas chlororaphis subsp. aurantiaca]
MLRFQWIFPDRRLNDGEHGRGGVSAVRQRSMRPDRGPGGLECAHSTGIGDGYNLNHRVCVVGD